MSRVLSNVITLSIVLTFSCRMMALDSIPIPVPRPERPLSVYDLDLKVEGKLPVVANKRNARQITYEAKPGVNSTARILESRKGMYLIAIYEDGRKLPTEYLISQKWANRILDIDAVLKVASIPNIIEDATSAKILDDCNIPVPTAKPKTEKELELERFKRAENLEVDQSLVDALKTDAIKSGCLKNGAKESELSEGLYDSLASLFALKGCSAKVTSIRSKNPSKAVFAVRPISSCAIELDFLTNDQKEGELEVTLDNGEKIPLSWKDGMTNHLASAHDKWLYSQGVSDPGFLGQEGFAKYCPDLAVSAMQGALIARKKSPIRLRGAKKDLTVQEEVEDNSGEKLALTLSSEIEEMQGPERVDLPSNIPVPIAKPERASYLTLPSNVPIPEAKPEIATENTRDTASAVSSKPLCEMKGVSAQWVKNCEALYRAGIPKDALEYALKVMQLNDDSFQSNKCYKTGPSWHYSMRGVTKGEFERKMSGGLPNKCQMVINDTRDKLGTYRGRMYYIDLCGGSSPKIVKSYFNMGTGTFKNNYADRGGAHTTVKGAFFTNYKTFSFQKNNSAYQAVKSRVKSLSGSYKAPSVQLFGLSTTNNEAGPNLKYMHVSGYKSSWGCPSISPDNYWMIEKLANNGPSLVLNYGTGMEDIKKCSE